MRLIIKFIIKYKRIIISTIILFALVISFFALKFYYFPYKELKQFQTACSQRDNKIQITELKKFIRQYPKSDRIPQAIQNMFNILAVEAKLKWNIVQYFTNLLTEMERHDIRQKLCFCINSISDTNKILPLENMNYSNIQVYNFLFTYYLRHEVPLEMRREELDRVCTLLISSDWDDPAGFIELSDSLKIIGDSLLIDMQNQLLQNAIMINNYKNLVKYHKEIPDKKEQMKIIFFRAFYRLARNAYHQRKYILAMNLISQTSKYNDISFGGALFYLGAIRAELGEAEQGLQNILEAYISDNEGLLSTSIHNQIYENLFHRIHGRNQSPQGYLERYRQEQ